MVAGNSGVNSWVLFGWETTFGTAATTIDKCFGQGVRLGTLNQKNNIEPIYELGNRNAQVLLPLKYEGSASIEFLMASPWFLRAIMGTVSSTTASPYTHTFSESNTIPSLTIKNVVNSATPSVRNLLGYKAAEANISCSIGEAAKVRLTGAFVNESLTTTTASSVAESFAPMHFAYGSLEIPASSTIALIQNCEINILNNPELAYGLGSRHAQQAIEKNRKYTIKTSMIFQQSADILTKVYGGATGPVISPAETATLNLTFDNGLTGTNQRQIKYAFTGVQFDEDSIPQDPTAAIIEDAVAYARSLTPTAINATATAP